MRKVRLLLSLLIAIFAALILTRFQMPNVVTAVQPRIEQAHAQAPADSRPNRVPHVDTSYGRLPLSFEANQGQTDGRVKFLSRGRGYALFLTGDEAVLSLSSQKSGDRSQNPNSKIENRNSKLGIRNSKIENRNSPTASTLLPRLDDDGLLARSALASASVGNLHSSIANLRGPNSRLKMADDSAPSVVRLQLVGANSRAKVQGLDELPGKSNYFIGNDPKKWRTNVANYAKVKYQGVYPGVDLVYYGHEGQMEYDFVVAPGADPKAIQLAINNGASKLENRNSKIDSHGDLVIAAQGGEVRFHKPVVYQEESGVRSVIRDSPLATCHSPLC